MSSVKIVFLIIQETNNLLIKFYNGIVPALLFLFTIIVAADVLLNHDAKRRRMWTANWRPWDVAVTYICKVRFFN